MMDSTNSSRRLKIEGERLIAAINLCNHVVLVPISEDGKDGENIRLISCSKSNFVMAVFPKSKRVRLDLCGIVVIQSPL